MINSKQLDLAGIYTIAIGSIIQLIFGINIIIWIGIVIVIFSSYLDYTQRKS